MPLTTLKGCEISTWIGGWIGGVRGSGYFLGLEGHVLRGPGVMAI